MWRGLTAAATAIALTGCATGRIARTLKPLSACPAERGALPQDWRRHDAGNGFSLALPPQCDAAQDVPEAVHGASRWSCGAITVGVYWGMWGAEPSDEPRPCKAKAGNVPIVVTRDGGGAQEAVWYLTGHVHEPTVDVASGSAADWPIVLGITRSGVLSGPAGPNR